MRQFAKKGKSVDTASSELFAKVLPKCVILVENALLNYSSHYACELAIFAANRLPEFLRVFDTKDISSRDMHIKTIRCIYEAV